MAFAHGAWCGEKKKRPHGLKRVEKCHRQMHKREMAGRMAESEHTRRAAPPRGVKGGRAPHVTAPRTTA